jgi:hypothetical protein
MLRREPKYPVIQYTICGFFSFAQFDGKKSGPFPGHFINQLLQLTISLQQVQDEFRDQTDQGSSPYSTLLQSLSQISLLHLHLRTLQQAHEFGV